MSGAPLFDAVLRYLADHDIEVEREGTDTVARFRGDGRHGSWLVFLSTDEDAERCVVYSVAPFLVDDDRRSAVMELFTRINPRLAVGSYEIDLDTGQLAFRTGIDVEGDRLSDALLAQLVATNVSTYDTYLPALTAVLDGTGPVDAIAALGDVDT